MQFFIVILTLTSSLGKLESFSSFGSSSSVAFSDFSFEVYMLLFPKVPHYVINPLLVFKG